MIVSSDAGKTFDETLAQKPTHFHDNNTQNKLRIEDNFFNLLRVSMKLIIPHVKDLKVFS